MSKPKKIGKDAIGKTKGVGFIQSAKERAEYEEYKRRKAEEEEEEEKQKKKQKKVGSEKMPDEREPTPEQLAEQEAKVREDIARFKALKRGETVYVKEHHRRRPSAKEEENEEEEEEDEEE